MNSWQVINQIAYELGKATWPDGATESVFGQGGTYATAGAAEEAAGRVRFPYAIVMPGSVIADPDHPELEKAQFKIVFAVHSTTDPMGESALIGGGRSGGQGSSKGRGLLEIEEEVKKAAGEVNQTMGLSLFQAQISAVEPLYMKGFGYVATRTITLEGLIHRERFYHPATEFTATDATSGNASLSWVLPPDRWDRERMVLRRASGATAPTSATAGTGVTLAADLSTSHTDNPGAGQFSYALFAAYNETDGTTNERFSSSVTATVTAT